MSIGFAEAKVVSTSLVFLLSKAVGRSVSLYHSWTGANWFLVDDPFLLYVWVNFGAAFQEMMNASWQLCNGARTPSIDLMHVDAQGLTGNAESMGMD